MACFDTGTVIGMAAREAVTLDDIQGATLRVTRGTVWLTQHDDRHDVILRAGDNFMVERKGATVLEAQEDESIVCVVGRHVDERAQARRARDSMRQAGDWRDRLARLFTPMARRHAPYF